jgi:2-succinyl-5-enolpyruvyl-6-hydroxy-3-cyclohexene-1-carboxylate synthase
MNNEIVDELLRRIGQYGVQEIIVSPGSYNSPIFAAAEKLDKFKLTYHFDERGAAFLALGKIKADKKPVAVCVTSGTAVAECLPAVIEAKYTGLPLIIISGDRPKRFVGSGAPQVIEQIDVLTPFVNAVYDIEEVRQFSQLGTYDAHLPCHFNVRFEEPLFGSSEPRSSNPEITILNSGSELRCRPLIILSELDHDQREEVLHFVKKIKAPVIAEPLSGLRESTELSSQLLHSSESCLDQLEFDQVIRIGGVPVTKLWRDLERKDRYKNLSILCYSDLPYSGLARESVVLPISELRHFSTETAIPAEYLISAKKIDQGLYVEFLRRREESPRSELSLIHHLSQQIPANSVVYLGNSLPIREWGAAAIFEDRRFDYHANRGANGIDGQIATFVGLIDEKREAWGILGDLTFLYDISSLALLAQTRGKFRLVVMNNRGGQIFSSLPYFSKHFAGASGERFINAQKVELSLLAQAFGLKFIRSDTVNVSQWPERCIVELTPI